MKKMILAILRTLILLISFTLKLSSYKDENLIRNFTSNEINYESLNYLNSYNDVDLKITNYDLIFNGKLNADFLDSKLDKSLKVNFKKEENNDSKDYLVNFKTIYVQELNIIYMKVNLTNDDISLDEINIFGMPDLLNIFGYYNLDKYYLDYDNFERNVTSKNYFIITFFNVDPVLSDLNTLKAHTIFIKRDFAKEKSYIAYNNTPEEQNETEIYKLIKSSNENIDKRLIAGIIIR